MWAMRVHPAFLRSLAVALICAASGAFAQSAPPDEAPLQITLEAPEGVRALLERHLRILRVEQVAPERAADRVALLRRTRRDVEQLLSTEGYFSPVVRFERAGDARWRIEVDPGVQATIDEVELEFTGDLAREDSGAAARRDSLRSAWPLRVGQPFRQSAWDGAKQQLLYSVSVRDYAAARIADSRAAVDPATASVRLSVTVDSGPPFRLGELRVRGIERLPPELVERYSTLEPGERFDQDRLLAFQSELQAVPQFASVVVDIPRDPALADAVPVDVRIVEAQTRELGFGAGFSTNTGARVETTWRDVNFLDRAWELNTGLRIEQRRQTLYADVFLPPAAGGYRDSFGAVVESSDIEGLQQSRYAFGAVRSHVRGDIETALALRYQRETLDPKGGEETRTTALTANWSWTQRKVDDMLDPRSGYVLHGEIGGGAEAVLSDQDFLRLYGRAVRYQPVGMRDVFILRGELGATLADSRDGIPLNFLFRTGGAQSVRGYAYQSLGVREGAATLGGRYMAAASAEYVHWFREQWGVASFVDVGDAADSREDLDPKLGVGVGARWRSPAGPIALDLAWGHDERDLRLHFAVAVAF